MTPRLDDQTRKRLSTARAKAARLGATLIDYEDDFDRWALTVTKWCLTRTFTLAQLDELEALLDAMAGNR